MTGRTFAARIRITALLALTVMASACGTGPDRLTVGGSWSGTTDLTTAHSTTLTLIQSGATISGNITIAGLLASATFIGTLDESNRTLNWTSFSGCEEWSGTLTVNSDSNQMSGPVLQDVSSCASGANASGTITLSKS